MPNKVGGLLNRRVESFFTPGEIGAASPPFVGVALQNLATQRVQITGLVWTARPEVLADRANTIVSIFCQRGLTLDPNLPLLQNVEEQLFGFVMEGSADSLFGLHEFVAPVALDPGNVYAVALAVNQRAAFANNCNATLCVLGRQESTNREQFPFNER